MTKIAVVRVRGIRKMNPKIKHTLALLRLHKPNHCIILDDTPITKGMLEVVRDYITYGSIDEKTMKKLVEKRSENAQTVVFRLHPPRKGYKNIKLPYPSGDLGKRKEMDSLLKRMM